MLNIIDKFCLDDKPASCKYYGNGHINKTYLLVTNQKRRYLLQKINHSVFGDVPSLMSNIVAVTSHLACKVDDPRQVLKIIPTVDGKNYFKDDNNEYWRIFDFITDSVCLECVQNVNDFYQSAIAFGKFQNMLSDFPAETLHETIVHFHDTVNRYKLFHEAVKKDVCSRVKNVQREIEFVCAYEKVASTMIDMRNNGELPIRVTHNDTKLNNVLFDKKTHAPLCVIDLDTVMPGLAANDFGDSIRFGASTAAEDEKDLSKVSMSLDLYEAYVRGFHKMCGQNLTNNEIETLPLGAKLMTLECGVRFLTDYLSGDTYFNVHYPDHNLDRARTQFKLVEDYECKWGDMHSIIERVVSEQK